MVGEDNAALLGSLLVTKIQLAAMSRADIAADQRTPFYLYVDEFQNFATDSFATILSEARKYGLNLTVANQYIAQMSMEVKDAVFGNVGSIIAFRMGADDARSMLRYFEPKFEEYDLVHMHNRHFVISMTIEGEKTPAFSAISLNLPPQQADYSAVIADNSRRQYASSREVVERFVNQRYNVDAKQPAPAAAGQPVQPSGAPAVSAMQPPRTAAAPPAAQPVPPTPAEPSVRAYRPRIPLDIETGASDALRALQEAANPASRNAAAEQAPAKRKRKRTRRRKRKPTAGGETAAAPSRPAASPPSQSPPAANGPEQFTSQEIILRH